MSNMIQKIMSEKYRQQLRVLTSDPKSAAYEDLTNDELQELEKLIKKRFLLSPVKRRAKRYGYFNLVNKGWESAHIGSPIRLTKREGLIIQEFFQLAKGKHFYFYRVEGDGDNE